MRAPCGLSVRFPQASISQLEIDAVQLRGSLGTSVATRHDSSAISGTSTSHAQSGIHDVMLRYRLLDELHLVVCKEVDHPHCL